AVIYSNRVGLGESVFPAEVLDFGVIDTKAPGYLALALAFSGIGELGDKLAYIAGPVLGNADRAHLIEVGVREVERAGGIFGSGHRNDLDVVEMEVLARLKPQLELGRPSGPDHLGDLLMVVQDRVG